MDAYTYKTAVTFACVAIFVGSVIVALCIPLYLGKIAMNKSYGFRCGKAFESDRNWYLINKFGARACMVWGSITVMVGILCLFISPSLAITFEKGVLIGLIVPLVLTSLYGRTL
jgi:hypothetical protein